MNWYEWRGEDQKKLDDIERQHASNKARLKAVVEEFLLGEGPLWRSVIHALHKAEESDLAEKIKTNAEPHHGEWLSVERQVIRFTHVGTLAYWGQINLVIYTKFTKSPN